MTTFDTALTDGSRYDLSAAWGAALIVGGATIARLIAGLLGWFLINRKGWRAAAILVEVVIVVAVTILVAGIGVGISGASLLTVIFAALAALGLVVQDIITMPSKK